MGACELPALKAFGFDRMRGLSFCGFNVARSPETKSESARHPRTAQVLPKFRNFHLGLHHLHKWVHESLILGNPVFEGSEGDSTSICVTFPCWC